MGMYTGLRVKVYVKEEYRELIKDIIDYAEWKDFKDTYSFLKNFTDLVRNHMIPNGTLSYMPEEWSKQYIDYTYDIDMNTGYWSFQCSVNYGSEEIYTFINEVLSEVIYKSDYIEVHYEEDNYGELYEYIEGKIVKSENTVQYI